MSLTQDAPASGIAKRTNGMTKRALLIGFALAAIPCLGQTAPAPPACTDAMINAAFVRAFQRSPDVRPLQGYMALPPYWPGYYDAAHMLHPVKECDRNRYAGGSYGTDSNKLFNYVKYSVVCGDPWIGEAFLDIGRSPLGIGTAPYSTAGDCNTVQYGTWGDYPTLVRNVVNHFAPSGSTSGPPVTSAGAATILGPAAWLAGQPATVTWSITTPNTCATGVQVVMQLNGANIRTGNTVFLTAGKSVIPATSYGAGTIPLALMDLCSAKLISPTFNSVITTPGIPLMLTGPGPLSGLDARGCLVDARGALISSTCGYYFLSAGMRPVGRGNYAAYLNGQPVSVASMNPPTGLMVDGRGSPVFIVASGAGNYQIKVGSNIVASGAGNIVASGAGNIIMSGGGSIVASGAGNIILNGSGNIVASGAGNLQVTTSALAAAKLTGLLAPNGTSLITLDGLGIVNTNGSNLLR
jgi:hypothetical protein